MIGDARVDGVVTVVQNHKKQVEARHNGRRHSHVLAQRFGPVACRTYYGRTERIVKALQRRELELAWHLWMNQVETNNCVINGLFKLLRKLETKWLSRRVTDVENLATI